MVNIEILAPDTNMGDLAGDLSSKRGQVTGTQNLRGSMVQIKGMVPLSELNNYHSRLKSVTGGQGSYSLELSHYEAVPPTVQQQLVAQKKVQHEDD